MEHQLLQVLQQRAAGPMYHALRETGGAGGVHDVERMIERKADELCSIRWPASPLFPVRGARDQGNIRTVGEVGHHDYTLDLGQALANLADALQAVDLLPGIAISVRGDEDARTDLAEPVEDAAGTEVRGAGGPDRPDTGRAEHRDDGFGQIREEARDPIAGLYSIRTERRANRGDRRVQLAIAEGPLTTAFVPEDQRFPIVVKPEQVLRKVEPRPGEPPRTELRVGRCHPVETYDDVIPGRRAVPTLGYHPAEPPNLGPERVGTLDGPPI